MKPPVDGWARENWASVLPSSAIAMPAATMVSGEATPAVMARNPNPYYDTMSLRWKRRKASASSTIP
jgi:hypothetical protein